ncbi:putative PLAC8 motif-containing protein [Helianthus annuus]|nr:putative PLAC8 motif-containing protein [Helianthus annuus]
MLSSENGGIEGQVNGSHGSVNNTTSRFHQFRRKLDWDCLKKTGKEWIRNPMNMVLLIWILCVTISGAILFLVMTGMLNNALPKKYQREAWFEVNNQILNALFTLICLYHHPRRIHHLVLLLRWRSEDVHKLRKEYCKNGTYKPNERMHMLIVVLLLNLNCFAQYALCALNVGYTRSKRPAIGVAITISVAIAAPAIAGVYTIVSPLGKDYDLGSDEESQIHNHDVKRVKSLERRLSFSLSTSETSPKWSGGILDFWNDISIAYLSLFFSCCVFGWNMERLGFGNMYVHTATFLLVCLAPFWIFTMAAINISNETIREALGTTGLFLCVFGLLYGGFWRIQMRKRYNLPPSSACCGKPAVTDCALWLFCCWCSLAQEVRTGNSYDIVEDKFYKKPEQEPGRPGTGSPVQHSFSLTLGRRGLSDDNRSPTALLSMVEEGSSSRGKDATLQPPFQNSINREGN